jgi:hypothetical protein
MHDAKGDRLLVWDGKRCLELSLSRPERWTQIAAANEPPPNRSNESVIYDRRNDQIVVFGGRYDMNDTWALSLHTKREHANIIQDLTVAPAPAIPSLRAPTPNPSPDGAQVDFALPEAGHVSLVVFDTAGRRVRSLSQGAFAPGKHSLKWDGRDDGGRLAPIGLYLMRLETRGGSVTQKIVIAR